MNIAFTFTFGNKDKSKAYMLGTPLGNDKNKVWLASNEGEGGEFNGDEISDVLYQALDKYFKEKF